MNDEMRLLPPPRKLWVRLLRQTGVRLQLNIFKLNQSSLLANVYGCSLINTCAICYCIHS